MAHTDRARSLRSDDGLYNDQHAQETSRTQGYVGGARPMPGPMSLSSEDGTGSAQQISQSQVILDDLSKWEDALKDKEIWSKLLDKGSPSDLLVHLYFLKSEWTSAVRQIKRNKGDRDAMEALLNYVIQSSEPTWPQKLKEGLVDCSQKLLADRLSEKYEDISRRPVYGREGQVQSDASMNQPPEPRSRHSMAIIEHRELYEKAVRKLQKDLRKNIDPMRLLPHIPYIHKDRIQAAMNTSGRGAAMDEFLEELMYPQRDNDWPQDLVQALCNESQSVLADLLKKEYFDLRMKAFGENKCPALRNYLTQQHPTRDTMDVPDQAVPMDHGTS